MQKKYSKVIVSSFVYIPRNELLDYEGAKARLTVQRKYEGEPVPLYDDSRSDVFGVPLYFFRNLHAIADTVEDLRVRDTNIHFSPKTPLWESQRAIASKYDELLKQGATGFVISAPPGFGKSHPKGTELLMYSGEVKNVEDVVSGDLLMGPDSTPRLVLNTHKGFGKIYRITPRKGDSWECNEPHVLSLKLSPFTQVSGNRKTRKYRAAEIINIPLDEYIRKSSTFKHRHKLWRTGVNFPSIPCPEIDPYLVGLYLADGTKRNNSTLCCGTEKIEAIDYVRSIWHDRIEKFERGAWYISLHGFFGTRKKLVTSDLQRNIPESYLFNSREARLQLIAGILDGDGSLVKDTVFDVICKDGHFKNQLLFLARSLGFAAYASECAKGIKSRDFSSTYWRITISGDTDVIPTKITKKRAKRRNQKKDVLVTGFSVEYVRDDFYYGIAVGGDHLYLLKDFTVTHNTVLLINMVSKINEKTLVVVPRSNLVQQWVDRFLQHSDIKEHEIGVALENRCSYVGKKVVIGLVHSIALDRYGDKFRHSFGCTVYDEVDRSVPPTTFAPVVGMFPSYYRMGASATIKRSDGLDKVFEAHMGQHYLYGSNENRMPARIIVHKFTESSGFIPHGSKTLNRRGMIISKLAANPQRHYLLVNYIKLVVNSGRRCLVLSDRTTQLSTIRDTLVSQGMKREDIGFYVRTMKEYDYKKKKWVSYQLSAQKRDRDASACKVLLGTYGMIAIGTDIPDLAGLVQATPQSDMEQSQGRIERMLVGKKEPIVVDILDTAYPDTVRWYRARQYRYNQKGLKIKYIGG